MGAMPDDIEMESTEEMDSQSSSSFGEVGIEWLARTLHSKHIRKIGNVKYFMYKFQSLVSKSETTKDDLCEC